MAFLETALQARALAEDLRIVVRLYDDDPAERVGQLVEDVQLTGEVRVLALRKRGANGLDWSPPRGYRLMPTDRLFVLATRGAERGAHPQPSQVTVCYVTVRQIQRNGSKTGSPARARPGLRSGQIFDLVLLSQV
jgi:hypothetical protein